MSDIETVRSIFILGIKGAAMANLAVILHEMGKSVTGVDVDEEFITDKILKDTGIDYSTKFDPASIPENCDLFIYSAAHGGLNNELAKEAQKRGIAIRHQVDVIADIMQSARIKIAVAGSAGKTTTSALLAHALVGLNQNPSYMIGVPQFGHHPGGKWTNGEYFVVEADEYGMNPPTDTTPKFLRLNPDFILATNIDFDHPDTFKDLEDVMGAFAKFFDSKKLLLCADDVNLMDVVRQIGASATTFGYSPDATLRITDVVATEHNTGFELEYKDKSLGKFEIELYGAKNVSNAAGVILCLLELGFDVDRIKKALLGFTGATRRFEKKAYISDTYLFDDYAHHPAKISAAIEAAKARFPTRRLGVIFQPHTYSRTEALYTEFADALSGADYILVAPIFPSARENPEDFNVSSKQIEEAQEQGIGRIKAYDSKEDLIKDLPKYIKRGDVIFTMGAGDIYKLENDIIEAIKSYLVYKNMQK